MITISDIAAEKGKQLLESEGKPGWGFRIFLSGSSCCGPSFGMDLIENPIEGDDTVEKNGLKVFIDKNAMPKLEGLEIHFVEEGENSGFVIRGNQPSSCGPSCSSCG